MNPSPYYKLGHMLAWHREFHGEFPKTVLVTAAFAKLLYQERPELRRKRSILGAKIVVMPDTIRGKTMTHFIADDLEGDLDVRSPWATDDSCAGPFDVVPISISDCPADFAPAGAKLVSVFDPSTGDSVTGFYDPATGVTHIQGFTKGKAES